MSKLGGGFTNNLTQELRSEADYYPTPKCAVDALFEHIKFSKLVWEPACGDGAITRCLEARGHTVYSSDIRTDKIHGDGGVDFLKTTKKCRNIITNPPFTLAEQFVQHALDNATSKVALLLRLAFLESDKRYKRIYSRCPPAQVIVIARRLPFFAKGKWVHQGSTFPHAWFVWDKAHFGATTLLWSTFEEATVE